MTAINSPPGDALASLLPGTSVCMQQLRTLIRKVAPSPLPVFITGETGVGQELLANALHVVSGRTGAFLAFNACAVGGEHV